VHFRVAEFLPTHECLKEDSKRRHHGDENGGGGLEFLRCAYKQPELTAEKEMMLVEFSDHRPHSNNNRHTTGMMTTTTRTTSVSQQMERGTRENNHTYGSGLPANVDIDETLKEAAVAVNEMQSMRQGHAVLSAASPSPPESLLNNNNNHDYVTSSGRVLAQGGNVARGGGYNSDDDDANDSLSESPSSVVASFLNSFSFASLPTSKMYKNRSRHYH
jgi:hypothetical protein